MKRIFVCLVLAILAAAPLSAQVNWWVGPFTKYMTQHGVVLYDKPSMQANLNYGLPHGAYVDLWADQSLDGRNNEVDYIVGWGNQYTDVNFAYYDLNPAFRAGGKMFMSETSAGVPFKAGSHSLRVYAKANYLSPRQAPGGAWLRMGATDSVSLDAKTTLDQSAWLMHDGGAFGGPRGYLLHYEAAVSFARNGYHLQPVVKISLPLQNMPGREREIAFGVIFAK